MIPGNNVGIMLKEPGTGSKINYELPGFIKTSFQMVVRKKLYVDGKALITAAVAALTIDETTLTGMYIKYMRPRHDPIQFPLTPGNNQEFLVNIDVCYVLLL